MMDPFVGEVRVFAGRYVPQGWLECNGRELKISAYPDLFKVIGNCYGGDGKSTFKVPELTGRIPVGAGAGPGLTPYALGKESGAAEVQLKEEQMPVHTHEVAARTESFEAMTASPGGGIKSRLITVLSDGTKSPLPSFVPDTTGAGAEVALHPDSILSVGNGSSHPNCHPYLAMKYLIAWQGTHPAG